MNPDSITHARANRPAIFTGRAASLIPILGALVLLPVGARAVENIVIQPTISGVNTPSIELQLPGTATEPGVTISYVRGANASAPNTTLFQLPREQDEWKWQAVNSNNGERLQMTLKADNSLELVEMGGQAKIILKPGNAAASIAPEITIGGVPVLTTTVANGAYMPINPQSLSVGWNDPSGFHAFAAGTYNTVSAEDSGAVGFQNSVTGKWGFAAGLQNSVTQQGAVALGYQNAATGWASFATGVNAIASGGNSIALGRGPQSIGDYSIAIGWGSKAENEGAIAIGTSVTASGNYSTALGLSTNAGYVATAFGGWTKATQMGAIAGGHHSEAIGSFSTALGDHNIASGNYSIAIGHGANATDNEAIALGYNARAVGAGSVAVGPGTASGPWSISLGYGTVSQGQHQVVIGYWNVLQGNANSRTPEDDLFIIGNGNGDAANLRSNAFAVKHNGDTKVSGNLTVTGTGTTSVTGTLNVAGAGESVVNGSLKVNGVLRVNEAGDLSMGAFTAQPTQP